MESSLSNPMAISFDCINVLALFVGGEQLQAVDKSFYKRLTGKSRLMTLKERRHALICVTVLL